MTRPNTDGSREWFFGTARRPRSAEFAQQVLPDDWYALIASRAESMAAWKFLDTRREAEDAAALAFAALPANRRAELLASAAG